MNIYSKSKDWRERILSNLASTPFTIQIGDATFQCASVGKITHHVPGSSKPVFKMENLLMSVRAELFGH